MSLRIEIEQLRSLMKSFFTLTNIRFVLFDCDFREIISYPSENCAFCALMKSCPKTRRKCKNADRSAIMKCKEENRLVVYQCHAGLVEAVIPIHENEIIIGYLMFGQITDFEDKKTLSDTIPYLTEKYGMAPNKLKNCIENITYKTPKEIRAAAKIMEACTSYIVLKELVTPNNDKIFEAAKEYILANLGENINAESICLALDIGRTRLYGIFRNELNMGISKYITQCRLQKAKKLLKTTELTIPEIADAVGFSDYNYFSRVYKSQFGKAPKSYRKSKNINLSK